jgi:anhydro-N-acetylmuramic acid kinase
MLFIGLMSGTSVDAVDGVLVEFESDASSAEFRTVAFASKAMPDGLRRSLLDLQQPGHDELGRAALASLSLTDLYAEVSLALIARHKTGQSTSTPSDQDSQIVAIGAHGQTVRHRPELGYTLQLIDGARLADRTGCPTVVDFRSADIAAGGQGAPLVPAFHALAFGSTDKRRAIVNIGGIANVSLLPVGGGMVTGFDTGPGNLLMDAWCERHLGTPFDRDGDWAAGGKLDRALLDLMLAEPYFDLPAPKSTGRDLFTPDWLKRQLAARSSTGPGTRPSARDVQTTLAELTALTIGRACRGFGADEIRVCGGGALNAYLMRRLADSARPIEVTSTAAIGIDPLAVEALAFAWLARQRILNRPGNLPAVTGARGPRVLGAVYPASPGRR